MNLLRIRTPVLDIACESHGPETGTPVIQLHGFPYDPRCYDDTIAPLVSVGCRVWVPYLRGYGPTRFLSGATPRSGEQAALGKDLLDFMHALKIEQAVLAGYDWGGRAACIVSALWPQRVIGLVTGGGYNIQDIAASVKPGTAEQERRYWYQYYFHTERGRAGLEANRYDICKLLWKLWSPNWRFDEPTYAKSAASFDNPDFVPVVIQSYRHRYGYAEGDPALLDIEAQLATQPKIGVPTICLHGEGDGVAPPESSAGHAKMFSGKYERRTIPVAGHNLPQEAPVEWCRAVLELARR
ncbi:MAG: alpha/beta fold hydrolase [Reyranellaceae bacterium]